MRSSRASTTSCAVMGSTTEEAGGGRCSPNAAAIFPNSTSEAASAADLSAPLASGLVGSDEFTHQIIKVNDQACKLTPIYCL